MILIKLSQLIVNVYRPLHILCELLEHQLAWVSCLHCPLALFIISHLKLHNLIGHYLDYDSHCQKNHTENSKLEHGAQNCRNRSPSLQSLLLEL